MAAAEDVAIKAWRLQSSGSSQTPSRDGMQAHPATSDRPPARQTVTRSHPPAPTAPSGLACRRHFQAAGAGLGEVLEPLRPLGGADGYWRSNVIQRDYDLERRSR